MKATNDRELTKEESEKECESVAGCLPTRKRPRGLSLSLFLLLYPFAHHLFIPRRSRDYIYYPPQSISSIPLVSEKRDAGFTPHALSELCLAPRHCRHSFVRSLRCLLFHALTLSSLDTATCSSKGRNLSIDFYVLSKKHHSYLTSAS